MGPNTSLRPTGWNKGAPPPKPAPVQGLDPSKSSKPSRYNNVTNVHLYGYLLVCECPSCRSSSSGARRGTEGRDGRGPSGRGSGSGMKRSHTTPTPEQEKESALLSVKQITNKDAPAQAVLQRKVAAPVVKDKLEESAVTRKITSIIDELVNNADYRVGVTCFVCLICCYMR